MEVGCVLVKIGPKSNFIIKIHVLGPMELGDIHGWDKDHAHRYLDYIDSTFTSDGCIPTLDQVDTT